MKKLSIIKYLLLARALDAFQLVDINQASVEQLALLPGVGDKLAAEIVVTRSQKGPFLATEQLLLIPGMSAKKLDLFRKHIVVGQQRAAKKTVLAPKLVTLDLKPLPDLSKLEMQVLKAHDLTNDSDLSRAHRVRLYAWLPKLSAGFDAGHDRVLTEKRGDNSRDAYLTRGARDIGVGVRLTFDLDKLIFNHDELEVAKLALKRLEIREDVLKKTHQHYFAYVSLHESAQTALKAHEASKIILEMREIAAKLDAMSNGAFTKLQSQE